MRKWEHELKTPRSAKLKALFNNYSLLDVPAHLKQPMNVSLNLTDIILGISNRGYYTITGGNCVFGFKPSKYTECRLKRFQVVLPSGCDIIVGVTTVDKYIVYMLVDEQDNIVSHSDTIEYATNYVFKTPSHFGMLQQWNTITEPDYINATLNRNSDMFSLAYAEYNMSVEYVLNINRGTYNVL